MCSVVITIIVQGKVKDKKTKVQAAKSTDNRLSIEDMKNLHAVAKQKMRNVADCSQQSMLHMFAAKRNADDERR